MAATYDVLFRNMDNIEIEDVDGFEATGELLTALDASGKVVGVFPIQALSSVTRTDETDDGDDGEARGEDQPTVVNISNYLPGFPARMQSKVG